MLRLDRGDGSVGFGEASVVDWLGSGGSARDVARALDSLCERVAADRPSPQTLLRLTLDDGLPSAVRAGLQTALLDAEARAKGTSVAELLGAESDAALPISALVGEGEPEAMAREAAAWVARGYAGVKLKVGRDAEADLRRARALREAIGPAAELRLDANRAWSHTEAMANLARLRAVAPAFVEEPCDPEAAGETDPAEWQALRALVPVAADESIADDGDLERALERRSCDVLVVKLERVGGPLPALHLAARARAAGLAVVFTDSIESEVGRAATVHVARAAYRSETEAQALGLGGLFLLQGADGEAECRAIGPGLGAVEGVWR